MMRSALVVAAMGMLASFSQVPQTQQTDISTWAAKDMHQSFVVATEDYSDAARSKQKFGKVDPYKAGILAVDVYFRNDTKDPVHVDLTTIRLNIDGPNGQRFHLEPLSLQQTAAEIAHPQGPSAPTARRFPTGIPFPGGDNKQQDAADRLRPFTLKSDIVPPGETIHGCLFFDLNHHFDMTQYASLYVPDVKSLTSSTALIYFEVALAPSHLH